MKEVTSKHITKKFHSATAIEFHILETDTGRFLQ